MKQVIHFLRQLGLSSTEINLYLNGLRYSTVGVAKLVELSSIKRTTAYHALETLTQKGLASQAKEDGKLVYRMTPADELSNLMAGRKEQLEAQLEHLRELVPLFPIAGKQDQDAPEVTNYYGIDGVHAAVDRALYCKSREWRIISPKSNFFRNSDPAYIKYFMKLRADRDINALSLWESPDTVRRLSEQTIASRQPRILPPKMRGNFKSTIILFDNNVLIISSYSKKMATIISGQEAYETLKLMFDLIWDISEPLKAQK